MDDDEVKVDHGQIWEDEQGHKYRVRYVHQRDVGLSGPLPASNTIQVPLDKVRQWRLVGGNRRPSSPP